MVAAIKLLHLLEAFSTPWFLFSAPSNHHLVFFLLEIFNNIIQYQFDGNSNLVYTIIRKRHVFHALANIPSDAAGISKCLNSRKGGRGAINQPVNIKNDETNQNTTETNEVDNEGETEDVAELSDTEKSESNEVCMEGSKPAQPAEPGTLKASLLDTPNIGQMTEKESAHPLGSPQTSSFDIPSPTGKDEEKVITTEIPQPKLSPKKSPSLKRSVNQVNKLK